MFHVAPNYEYLLILILYFRELLDPPPGTDVIPEGPVTYEVLTGGTRGGGRMLLSSDGFSYNVKVCILLIYIHDYVNTF